MEIVIFEAGWMEGFEEGGLRVKGRIVELDGGIGGEVLGGF
jgi:hypothetical protein